MNDKMKNFKKYLLKAIDYRRKTIESSLKHSGVTLIELLIATGISAIVITSVMATVGSLYFTQKKIRFTQNFYAESRILMERVAQMARNNTIDYDRFFVESGPDTDLIACGADFEITQVPSASTANSKSNRESLGYSSIFYWDTKSDGVQDRNLGGTKPDGTIDPCAQAFDGAQETLYLINGGRTLRTAIRNKGNYSVSPTTYDNTTDYRIEVQQQLGADTDKDLVADRWGPYDADLSDGSFPNYPAGDIAVVWDDALAPGVCGLKYFDSGIKVTKILGDETDRDFCRKAYNWTSISPKPMKIVRLDFTPSPDRDPFLNFRIDSVQIHPHVFINMETDLRDPSAHGFEVGSQPTLSFQTSVSSRVFGNTR